VSTRTIDCDECRTLLGGYVLSALDDHESATVRRHLAACRECAREFAELDDIPTLLDLAGGEKPAQEPLPARLEETVLDRFAREHRLSAGHRARARRGRLFRLPSRRVFAGVLAGVAAAAALAVGLVVAGDNGGGTRERTGEAYRAQLAGATGAHAWAKLVTFSSGTHVQLRVAGLHDMPGAVYELWCLRDDGAKVSAGTFRVGPNGSATVSLMTAALPSEYHRLSVSREELNGRSWASQRVLAGTIE
jgi:anti-sigma-K factor RskA